MTETKAIVRKLLRIQRQQDKWHDEINDSDYIQVEDPIAGNRLLLNLALDILGVPKDNTVETGACEIASTTGQWPEGAYCRDWADDAYRLMVAKHGDIDGFIKVVTGELEIPETALTDDDIEAWLYT